MTQANGKRKQAETLPPHSIEIERGLLGAILIDQQRELYDVIDLITADKFYSAKHRRVWDAMLYLEERHGEFDILTLAERLNEIAPGLFEGGAESFLIGLMNAPAAIRATSARHYAKILHEKFVRRRMIKTGEKIATLGWDEDEPIEIAMDRAESAALSMDPDHVAHREDAPDVYMSAVIDHIMASDREQEQIPGMPTGIGAIDRAIGGLRKGHSLTVGARPGMGKTSFLLDVARRNALHNGKRVLFFAMEARRDESAIRILAQETGVDHRKIDRQQMDDDERTLVLEAAARLSESKLFISQVPYLWPEQMRAIARRVHAQHGLDLVMVDYLQLMTVKDARGYMNENARLTEISRAVKALAGELDVAILSAAQLSRAVENRQRKKPELSDLRGSGTIEQDSDAVIFIYRDDYYNGDLSPTPGLVEFAIPKNRHGPTRVWDNAIEARWIARYMRFEDLNTVGQNRAKVYAGANGHGPNGHGEPAPINL